MGDLPGPEKKLDWAAIVGRELSPTTAARPLYSPSRVRPRHRIAIMLHEAGMRPRDIARALGYTEARLSVILNSHNRDLQALRAGFASEVADNVKDVQIRFKLYANEMLDRLVSHARQSTDVAQSRLAARDILYMAGFTPVKKQLTMSAEVPFEELKRVTEKISEAHEAIEASVRFVVSNPQEKADAA